MACFTLCYKAPGTSLNLLYSAQFTDFNWPHQWLYSLLNILFILFSPLSPLAENLVFSGPNLKSDHCSHNTSSVRRECDGVFIFLALLVESPKKQWHPCSNEWLNLGFYIPFSPKMSTWLYLWPWYVLSTYSWVCGKGPVIQGTVGTGHGVDRLFSWLTSSANQSKSDYLGGVSTFHGEIRGLYLFLAIHSPFCSQSDLHEKWIWSILLLCFHLFPGSTVSQGKAYPL